MAPFWSRIRKRINADKDRPQEKGSHAELPIILEKRIDTEIEKTINNNPGWLDWNIAQTAQHSSTPHHSSSIQQDGLFGLEDQSRCTTHRTTQTQYTSGMPHNAHDSPQLFKLHRNHRGSSLAPSNATPLARHHASAPPPTNFLFFYFYLDLKRKKTRKRKKKRKEHLATASWKKPDHHVKKCPGPLQEGSDANGAINVIPRRMGFHPHHHHGEKRRPASLAPPPWWYW